MGFISARHTRGLFGLSFIHLISHLAPKAQKDKTDAVGGLYVVLGDVLVGAVLLLENLN